MKIRNLFLAVLVQNSFCFSLYAQFESIFTIGQITTPLSNKSNIPNDLRVNSSTGRVTILSHEVLSARPRPLSEKSGEKELATALITLSAAAYLDQMAIRSNKFTKIPEYRVLHFYKITLYSYLEQVFQKEGRDVSQIPQSTYEQWLLFEKTFKRKKI